MWHDNFSEVRTCCRSVQEDIYEKDNLQRCLTVFHDFDERLLSVLRETDPDTVTEHGLYERPALEIPDQASPLQNPTFCTSASSVPRTCCRTCLCFLCLPTLPTLRELGVHFLVWEYA